MTELHFVGNTSLVYGLALAALTAAVAAGIYRRELREEKRRLLCLVLIGLRAGGHVGRHDGYGPRLASPADYPGEGAGDRPRGRITEHAGPGLAGNRRAEAAYRALPRLVARRCGGRALVGSGLGRLRRCGGRGRSRFRQRPLVAAPLSTVRRAFGNRCRAARENRSAATCRSIRQQRAFSWRRSAIRRGVGCSARPGRKLHSRFRRAVGQGPPRRLPAGAALLERPGRAAEDEAQVHQQLEQLQIKAADFRGWLEAAGEVWVAKTVNFSDPAVQAAIRRFDDATRWQRAVSLLTNPPTALLTKLASAHSTELFGLEAERTRRRWTSADGPAAGFNMEAPANLPHTDLASGPLQLLATGHPTAWPGQSAVGNGPRTAVVLLSDGRHNQGPSPVETARQLAAQGIPLYVVALGSERPPADLAVAATEAPSLVFRDDQVRGKVVLADTMPPGKPFVLRIEHDGLVLWERALLDNHSRNACGGIPFSGSRCGRAVARSRE